MVSTAEDSGQFLDHPAEASKIEVIELPEMSGIDGADLRSVQKYREDNGLVHHQFDVQLNAVETPHGGLQPAKALAGF
nr:unnamed protein product [Spirometra erinaceieuropaei]